MTYNNFPNVVLQPEEHVRQYILHLLRSEFQYASHDVELEFPIQVGSNKCRLDIAIFAPRTRHSQSNIIAIVECKRLEHHTDKARDQLTSYLAACPNAEYGIIAAARCVVVRRTTNHAQRHEFKNISKFVTAQREAKAINYQPPAYATTVSVPSSQQTYTYATDWETQNELNTRAINKRYSSTSQNIKISANRQSASQRRKTRKSRSAIFSVIVSLLLYFGVFHLPNLLTPTQQAANPTVTPLSSQAQISQTPTTELTLWQRRAMYLGVEQTNQCEGGVLLYREPSNAINSSGPLRYGVKYIAYTLTESAAWVQVQLEDKSIWWLRYQDCLFQQQ